jgi:hypothetical protein
MIGNNIELVSIDKIIQHDLVRDFYEYGTKQGIEIYSKSHINSRMMSYLDAQQNIEAKCKEIIELLDDEQYQVQSEQIEKLAKLSE